ncbi:MAG: peptidylprolyl isomerase [Betaproteobacteria bacterium]
MIPFLSRRTRVIATLHLATFTSLMLANAPARAIDPALVIAESARARVTIADYDAETDKLSPAARAEFAAQKLRLTQFLDTLYTTRVLAADARATGLDKDPVLSRQIAIQVDRMLATARYAQLEAAASAQFDKDIEKYTTRARELYVTNKSKYATPEQVRAAHILIYIKEGKSDEARAKAESLRAKALAGADFTTLARENSDDASVSRNGGELGFFEMTAMDPAFSAKAFSMTKKGEISEPVKSAFGWHIILFEDRRPAAIKPFDEAKVEILADMRKRVKDDARSAAVRDVFSDPTLKVDNALIDQISIEGAAKSDALRATPPKP